MLELNTGVDANFVSSLPVTVSVYTLDAYEPLVIALSHVGAVVSTLYVKLYVFCALVFPAASTNAPAATVIFTVPPVKFFIVNGNVIDFPFEPVEAEPKTKLLELHVVFPITTVTFEDIVDDAVLSFVSSVPVKLILSVFAFESYVFVESRSAFQAGAVTSGVIEYVFAEFLFPAASRIAPAFSVTLIVPPV